jgi:acyl-CoA thioester hydrolase
MVERSYTVRWRVRSYELDSNGHVNNSVYLAYAEEVATLHAEALAFGRKWTQKHAGAWVVRKHEITYRRPAKYGDDLELTTTVMSLRGASAVRHTLIKLVDGAHLAEVTTEWVWVRASDGKPARLPQELVASFGA